MSRPLVTTAANGLPMWDTFEALFFVIAGIFIGIVIGVLFPSVWRSFRRRFRDPSRFQIYDLPLHSDMNHSICLDEKQDLNKYEVQHIYENFSIAQGFIFARHAFQQGRLRDAVQIYTELLINTKISKQETNRALFELSQTFYALGLHLRAFETGFELLNRKPDNKNVLLKLLEMCEKSQLIDKFLLCLNVYRGQIDRDLRFVIASHLCNAGEFLCQKNLFKESLELAQLALRWSPISQQARILLWQSTGAIEWNTIVSTDTKSLWNALAIDIDERFKISKSTGVSFAAGARPLADLIYRLSLSKDVVNTFTTIQQEYSSLTNWLKLSEKEKVIFEGPLFYALLYLIEDKEKRENKAFRSVCELIAPRIVKKFLAFKNWEFTDNEIQTMKFLYLTHECEVCKNLSSQFHWTCFKCLRNETLKPKLDFLESFESCALKLEPSHESLP